MENLNTLLEKVVIEKQRMEKEFKENGQASQSTINCFTVANINLLLGEVCEIRNILGKVTNEIENLNTKLDALYSLGGKKNE